MPTTPRFFCVFLREKKGSRYFRDSGGSIMQWFFLGWCAGSLAVYVIIEAILEIDLLFVVVELGKSFIGVLVWLAGAEIFSFMQ